MEVSRGDRKANTGSFFVAVCHCFHLPLAGRVQWQGGHGVLPSHTLSTQPIVCMCEYIVVLLVPKPLLFCSQRTWTDNVRKASVPLALFDHACLEERSPERSSLLLHAPTQACCCQGAGPSSGQGRHPAGSAPSQGPAQHHS